MNFTINIAFNIYTPIVVSKKSTTTEACVHISLHDFAKIKQKWKSISSPNQFKRQSFLFSCTKSSVCCVCEWVSWAYFKPPSMHLSFLSCYFFCLLAFASILHLNTTLVYIYKMKLGFFIANSISFCISILSIHIKIY